MRNVVALDVGEWSQGSPDRDGRSCKWGDDDLEGLQVLFCLNDLGFVAYNSDDVACLKFQCRFGVGEYVVAPLDSNHRATCMVAHADVGDGFVD